MWGWRRLSHLCFCKLYRGTGVGCISLTLTLQAACRKETGPSWAESCGQVQLIGVLRTTPERNVGWISSYKRCIRHVNVLLSLGWAEWASTWATWLKSTIQLLNTRRLVLLFLDTFGKCGISGTNRSFSLSGKYRVGNSSAKLGNGFHASIIRQSYKQFSEYIQWKRDNKKFHTGLLLSEL